MRTLKIDNNKLIFSEDALNELNIHADDRIEVCYWNINNKITFPVLVKGKALDEQDGRRVTKSGACSFRGQQRETLEMYGTIFYIQDFRSEMYKLVPFTEETDFSSIQKDLENINN